MCKNLRIAAVCLIGIVFWGISFNGEGRAEVTAENKLIAHGRYISQIGGCNDCHTSDFLLSGGEVPEKLWLAGSAFGWRGPWGTTYPPNLRLLAGTLTEKQWVSLAKTLRARPPMPWFDLNIMKERDLRALYSFMKYLGPGGKPAPAYVPPDKEPNTPYALFPSPPK
jgi:mono/diheme cytochrome c family protein